MNDHHAVCFVGSSAREKFLAEFADILDPDTHVLDFTELKIDDARELTRQSFLAPVVSEVQVFIVSAESITVEAQNALLKLFEEPPDRSKFYLLIPKLGMLLATLQSRLHIMTTEAVAADDNAIFDSFISASYGERIAMVGEATKNKDIDFIESLLEGSEIFASQSNDVDVLRSVSFVREMIGHRGASVKMLLESIALALPQK